MKWLILLLLFTTTGCVSYQQAQLDLLQQARNGIALCDQSRQEHRAVADELDTIRRKQLDEAFDADVREHQPLSPDWVIEHRRAYAVGLQAMVAAHAASVKADETQARNIKAIDAALERAQWLISMQMQLLHFKGAEHDPN
ncbi:MAG: hypothetical protein IT447_02905 [Phycisphaerales bacterium]|jgi:hypothetical protein|nr:hypothetical protein [Phycisphaerales bacterium]